MVEKIKSIVDKQMNEDPEDDEYEIRKLSVIVNKYLNGEFEDTLFYPKQDRIEILHKKKKNYH
jgi:hypothetical protein